MGWISAGTGGVGSLWNADELERQSREQSRAAYEAWKEAHKDDVPIPLQEQIEKYSSTLTEKEAQDTASYCLYVAKAEGFLPDLLAWVKENGLAEVQDARIQAAVLEYGKNYFSY